MINTENIFEFVADGIAIIIILFLISYVSVDAGKEIGRENLIQELCEKQTYDFCEIKIYTIKESK